MSRHLDALDRIFGEADDLMSERQSSPHDGDAECVFVPFGEGPLAEWQELGRELTAVNELGRRP